MQHVMNNAGYQSPDRLSTKVTHAPGGYSSLSLAWELPTNNHHLQANKVRHRHHTEQLDQSSFIVNQEVSRPTNGITKGTLNFMEENRLLEEQLEYYQRRNKMLRENIFGGKDNFQQFNAKYGNPPSHAWVGHGSQGDYNNRGRQEENGAYGRNSGYQQRYQEVDELQMAVREQSNRLQQGQRQFHRSDEGQRMSVKVTNPPGGRSSIVFG